ncbi:MAG: putative acyl-CoA dehydrogenase [Fimbriimonadaceae bacterium]|nr:putative acyl-CoA dehydrogenase [Fimbriimonadaceae bacterium]
MAHNAVAQAKGGSFLNSVPERTFTPEDFVGDEELMIASAEQFMRKEVMPIQDRIDAQEEGLMPALIRKAGELGFCGIDSPEPYGGLGLGKNLAARILEFLSLNASFSVTIGVTSGISQVGLALFGNEEQKKKYLPPLATGAVIGAYALSEPNSGTDALGMAARAEQRGSKWVLNGTKMWISNAKWAEQFLVMAKVGGEKVSAFLVERDFPGISISREEHKVGLKGSSTARVVLENAEIPLENLLYEEGKGHHVAFNALNLGRFKLASMSIGPAREAMVQAIAYAKDRRQFSTPISEFGLVRKKFADMATLFYASEAVIYRTGALIDEAFAEFGGTVEGNKTAAEEFSVECSACKVFATEAEAQIVDEAFQCYGGYGFTEEFPIARIYRDCRVSRIYEGTNEINRVFIGDRILRRIQEGKLGPKVEESSFIGELLGRTIQKVGLDVKRLHQNQLGALSDLVLLHYADQSVRARAKRSGHQMLLDRFIQITNPRAAAAYQEATGESVTLPAARSNVDEISDALYAKGGPL